MIFAAFTTVADKLHLAVILRPCWWFHVCDILLPAGCPCWSPSAWPQGGKTPCWLAQPVWAVNSTEAHTQPLQTWRFSDNFRPSRGNTAGQKRKLWEPENYKAIYFGSHPSCYMKSYKRGKNLEMTSFDCRAQQQMVKSFS